MRDVKRLFEETKPFERSLLWSGRDEAPPDHLEEKILGAYAAGPAAAAASAANASPAGKLTFLRLLRPYHLVIAMAAACAVGVITTVVARNDVGVAGSAPSAVDVSATRTPTVAPVAPQVREPAAAQATVVITPDSLPNAPPATRPQGSSVAAAQVGPSLERELELLDSVKASLGGGAPSDATRALDLYDAEFPRGTLRPEATVLRIRTLLLQGNRPAAQKLADDAIARHPSSVHEKRIRALLAE